MSAKHLKEAFVTNHNGTSITEISSGLSVTTLCILFRGLLLISLYHKSGTISSSWKGYFLIDYILLVLPLVLSCTIFSDVLHIVLLSIAALCLLLFYVISRKRNKSIKTSLYQICQSFLNAQVGNGAIPAVTTLRVFLNVLTAVAILGVDFPLFPRRYAKTETYGTGVMDLGVGCYVFGNALVSPEARTQERATCSGFFRVRKQILSVWPLIVLGLARLISVKAVDYQEHVSEYGVHWNFFFTLAVVRILSSLLLTLLSPQKSWLIAATIIIVYQLFLEVTDLKSFLIYGTDGQGARVGFLNANREGVFSVIGYVGIYMIGVQVGLYVLKKRVLVKEWIQVTCSLAVLSSVLFICTIGFQIYVEPVSRRMANLPFCIWIVGQCVAWLCSFLICDLILALAEYMTPGSHVPSTWNTRKSSQSSVKKVTPNRDSKKEVHQCLIEAINKNQLLYFLIVNILTGIVNMTVDTIHSSDLFSLFVLITYMFTNCLIVYLLCINNITVKFW
ncbi:PREDICTED: phosphatidylinositol-glycan biosynthesis class W protein [Nanorana parkeri]|uniref:phosphatidylinositol-glycan biosynthesis class W protein n=1 Tax=Nanorana parkeri TaxID=125878 RepID=UPI0008545AD2|nr:PREDICTED: phosphatidylinositol-glycan biosynthesis class W protein [Nanorana parkeri]